MSTPPESSYFIPSIPSLPSPSSSRRRGSFSSTFSFDPSYLVQAYNDADSNRVQPRKSKEGAGDMHPLAHDLTADLLLDTQEEEECYNPRAGWSIVDRMRHWRDDASLQHLYQTAEFWANKALSWTNDKDDAYWLGQIYFNMEQYSRAERLLTRTDCDAAERMYAFVDISIACRYLAAQCQMQQGKWPEAREMLGESNPFRGTAGFGPEFASTDGGIKFEASMCYLRGLLKLKFNRKESAKESFMEALALDVKCYEAFDQLIYGEMMTVDEEWEFVQSLLYKQQIPEDAEFVRLIYTSRLHKYKHAEEHALARQLLLEEYGLKDNIDVLYSFADAAYTQFKWMDCFTLTERILSLIDVHERSMALHIACMYHLPHLHPKLFILTQEMVDKEPKEAMTWYAAGVWYLKSKKWAEARRYLSKASTMNPRFAPALIALAHSYSFEGERDYAVTTYSTCARKFPGSHLPLMFIGMEHAMISRFDMADEALNAADKMCDGDPLLCNERGVMAYNRGNYEASAALFQKAVDISEVTQGSHHTWSTTYVNLGSAHAKLGRYKEACEAYRKILDKDPRHTSALTFMGKTYMLMGRLHDAIEKFQELLSIDPLNERVVELLNLALEANLDFGPSPLTMEVNEEKLAKNKEKIKAVKAAKVPHALLAWNDPLVEDEMCQ